MNEQSEHQLMVVRTAAEQFALAGAETCVRGFSVDSRLYYLEGKGGRCAMRVEEWFKYQRLCLKWQASPLDLAGATVISMLEQTRDEDEIFHASAEVGTARAVSREQMKCIHEALVVTLSEARDLVSSARRSLSIEDYEDALCGAFEKLCLSVGCLSALVERGGAE